MYNNTKVNYTYILLQKFAKVKTHQKKCTKFVKTFELSTHFIF